MICAERTRDERAETRRDKEAGQDGVADGWEADGYTLGHMFVLSLASGCRMVHKFDSLARGM